MSKETDLVLDTINMGLRQREYRAGAGVDKLVHHSDYADLRIMPRSSRDPLRRKVLQLMRSA
jgi:hypothetical protein